MTGACICRPRDPEGWVNEDCPVHGREAEEARKRIEDEHRPTYDGPDSIGCTGRGCRGVEWEPAHVAREVEYAAEVSDYREHLLYADENSEFDECIEECPGCHWEGNTGCEALPHGCDLCDPDGLFAEAGDAQATHAAVSG